MAVYSRRSQGGTTTLAGPRLFRTDSPVAKEKTDIQTFLTVAVLKWDQYTDNEKKEIISTLPVAYRKLDLGIDGELLCPLDPVFVSTDKVLRDQIALFKRNVKDGMYMKSWQEKARKAVKDRADGKFDNYLAQHVEGLFIDEDDEEDEGRPDSDGEFKLS